MYVCIYRKLVRGQIARHWNMSNGSNGSIGHSNDYWRFDLSSGSNGQMERPMDISTVFAFGELFIILYDMLASSTACWSKARVLALGICPLDPMNLLDTRMSIGHVTLPVDPMVEQNVQWTNSISKGHFDWVCMDVLILCIGLSILTMKEG